MKLVDNVIKADATLGVNVEPYDDTELRERVEALEEKPDKDTIYDDTALTERVTALENKPDKDTVYDDTAIKASVKANTDALGGHTVKSDVPADAKFTDTVYDDSEIKRRVAVNASDIADVNNHLEQGLQMVQAKQDATPSSALTDPAGTGIQLVANQKIDYDKLADAIIAKYQGQTLAGKAQSVKSALDTVRSVQDQTIKAEDSSTPCSYSAGDFFVYDGKLYKASADFSSVTLTADNISTYAEAQTQTAINALNQSLFNSPDVLASNIPVIKAYPDNSTQSFGTCYKLWYWKVYSTVYVFFDIDKTDTGTILYVPIKGYRPYYTNSMATWLTVHSGANNGITVSVRLGQASNREVYITPSKNAHIIGNFSYPAFD